MSEKFEERTEYPTFSKFWMMCGGGIHGAWKHRRYKDIKEMAEKLPKMAWDAQQQKIDKLERGMSKENNCPLIEGECINGNQKDERIKQLEEVLREILDKYEQNYCKWTIDVCEKALGEDK